MKFQSRCWSFKSTGRLQVPRQVVCRGRLTQGLSFTAGSTYPKSSVREVLGRRVCKRMLADASFRVPRRATRATWFLLQALRRALSKRVRLAGTPQGYSSDLVDSLLEYSAGLLERIRLTPSGHLAGSQAVNHKSSTRAVQKWVKTLKI